MKYYRVGVFASVSVKAENEDDAIHQVKKSVIDGAINIHDYEFEALKIVNDDNLGETE